MQVFKLYFKILKSAAPALIIYIVIFSVLIFFVSTTQNKKITGYKETKIDTALVNYDKDITRIRRKSWPMPCFSAR